MMNSSGVDKWWMGLALRPRFCALICFQVPACELRFDRSCVLVLFFPNNRDDPCCVNPLWFYSFSPCFYIVCTRFSSTIFGCKFPQDIRLQIFDCRDLDVPDFVWRLQARLLYWACKTCG
ncbi:hypothetical protein Droror1_Dr00006768 [Drosera rotundifolia]